ncbi:acyl-CoA dehydrogenase [Streptomyces dioscori]|uniref:Acyl-CoA dehydrogenase n=1 Tax=Streptomyces dioscori TaxID=2109333 RepID=A0A2P8QED0_9ACTN|nr:acyl-CoA dehydrogenase family protein [Streptomyces dioscori]PSM44603.1 acyl-CoA dehydrogenase [Streptomyces dioscori]
MPVDRMLPTQEAADLIDLVRDIADNELAPLVEQHERDSRYPEGLFALLGRAGLLGLPYPDRLGGGGQPYEVYLQAVEELAARWAAVAVAVSVHTLAAFPLLHFGTEDQQERWAGDVLDGKLIGGYSLSEPQAGSDAAALICRAEPTADGYRINGAKAWITHGGRTDFYTLFARTAEGPEGISCFFAPGRCDGLTFGRPEDKMGLHAIPTTSAYWDDAVLAADRRIGGEGQGLHIAFSALDSGRLGIAACATGLAQAALDAAVAYAQERSTFGRRIIDHQGLGFLLADMAAAVDSARATYLDAARRRDAGLPYTRQASVAKLVATDAAMKVTTDAVQVFGGYGYTREYPVERYMREAKIMQIFEGTNQIQRLVISRQLAR